MHHQAGDPSAREQRLQALLVAYLEASERGQEPDLREFVARYPEFGAELAEFLANRAQLDRLAVPLRLVAEAAQAEVVSRRTLGGDGAAPTVPGDKVRYFGDYELLEEIARGGMGVVFKARQVSLNRTVAVKMILKGELATEQDVQRFRTEAEAAANLDHPNIVPIYEVGEHEGQHYFSMKLIEGGSLEGRVGRLGKPSDELRSAARLVMIVARAVHYAHQRGILHRDLKPANVLLSRSTGVSPVSPPPQAGRLCYEPHITDFGLARRVEGERGQTASGAIVGTPSYMPPEQARAEKGLTTAVDVYSLGAILYELLTGQPPFRGSSPLETLMQVIEREPERPSALNPRVDRDLETICLKCLRKEPPRRYGSAEALAEDLEHWLNAEPIRARPAGLGERTVKWVRRRPAAAALIVVSGLATVLLLAGLGWEWWREADRLHVEQGLRGQEQAARQLAEQNATKAQDAEALSRARLAQFQVRRGLEQADQGDLSTALLWFVEALQADNQVPARQQVHRRRIALFLQQLPRLRHVLGPEPGFDDAAFSADGRTLVAFGRSNLHCWDAVTGTAVHPPVRLVSDHGQFSRDGRYLLTHQNLRISDQKGSRTTATLRVWDGQTGKPLGPPLVYPESIHSAVGLLSADGRRLVLVEHADRAGLIHVLDVATGKDVFPPIPTQRRVRTVTLSPDGRRIAATTLLPKEQEKQEQGPAWWSVWSAETGQQLVPPTKLQDQAKWEPPGYGDLIYVVFSPDSRLLLSVSRDANFVGSARLWDAAKGTPMSAEIPVSVRNHSRALTGFSPDGKHFFLPEDGALRLYETATGKPVGRPVRTDAWNPIDLHQAGYSPDGQQLVLAGGHAVQIGTAGAPDADLRKIHYAGYLKAVRFHPDGRQLLCVYDEGQVMVWDLSGARQLPPLPVGPGESVRLWRLGADGRRVVALINSELEAPFLFLEVRDTQTMRRLGPRLPIGVFPRAGWALSHDGQRLATCLAQGKEANDGKDYEWPREGWVIQVWDVASGRPSGPPLRLTGNYRHQPTEFAFSPDDRWLVAGMHSHLTGHRMHVWDVRTGQPLQLGTAYDHLQFSSDGQRVLTALVDHFDRSGARIVERPDKSAQVWDVATRQRIGPPLRVSRDVSAACFSPDGRRVLISEFGQGRVWDVDTGQPLHAPVAWPGMFSPDGARFLSVASNTVRIWDASSGRTLVQVPIGPGCAYAGFTADGLCLLTATQHHARLWDACTGEPVGPLWPHNDWRGEAPLQTGSDGRLVFTREKDDHRARIWDLRPDGRPAEDLVLLAQLLSGHRIDAQGVRVPLGGAEVRRAWEVLRAKYPEQFSSVPAAVGN